MSQTSNRPAKILMLEDEAFVGELYKRALVKAGYEVDIEPDGKKGLARAESDAYDIILLDLMLPSLSGLEVLKRLREDSKPPKVHAKIIITTNLEYQDKAREEIEKHADGYLLKANTTPRELVEFLSHINLPENTENK